MEVVEGMRCRRWDVLDKCSIVFDQSSSDVFAGIDWISKNGSQSKRRRYSDSTQLILFRHIDEVIEFGDQPHGIGFIFLEK